jgi:hypothetical protein
MRFFLVFVLLSTVCLAGPKRGVLQNVEYLLDMSASSATSGSFSLEALNGSLPASAVVQDMTFHVIEPFTTSSAASVTFGYSGVINAYVPAVASSTLTNNYVKNAGQVASSVLWDDTNDVNTPFLLDSSSKLTVSAYVTGPVTGGKALLHFDYFVPAEY